MSQQQAMQSQGRGRQPSLSLMMMRTRVVPAAARSAEASRTCRQQSNHNGIINTRYLVDSNLRFRTKDDRPKPNSRCRAFNHAKTHDRGRNEPRAPLAMGDPR